MIIGVYGNIGVGKSTISKYLKQKYHFHYLSLDVLAKEIEENNKELIKSLQELDSTKVDVLTTDRQQVDFEKMKEVIFYHPKQNKLVSKIIWRYVAQAVENYLDEHPTWNIVLEAAVLPVLKLKKIDYYFYVKSKHPFYKNYLEVIILNKIQKNYNRFQQKDFVLKNNHTTRELFRQVDQIMVNLLPQK